MHHAQTNALRFFFNKTVQV